MIISPGRRYIFVHIPKTGGTSMAMALEDRAHRDDILIGDTPKAVKRRGRVKQLSAKGRLWKHSKLADIDGVLSPEEIAKMLCFTLVRNPWDRMVSYYYWLLAQSFDHIEVRIAQDNDFGTFLRHPVIKSSITHSTYTGYMQDATGAAHGIYLRLEHLDEDIAPLAAHLGFEPQLPHVNQSERVANYRDAYTPELARLVTRLCAADIERFGYQF